MYFLKKKRKKFKYLTHLDTKIKGIFRQIIEIYFEILCVNWTRIRWNGDIGLVIYDVGATRKSLRGLQGAQWLSGCQPVRAEEEP